MDFFEEKSKNVPTTMLLAYIEAEEQRSFQDGQNSAKLCTGCVQNSSLFVGCKTAKR
jgi:hypothetical protein